MESMIENPFIITERIIPRYFCDRKEESTQMIKLLNNGNNVVLIAQRRIGKTGLIQFCFEKETVKEDYLRVYIDILSTTNLQEFTFLLGKEVFDSVCRKAEKRWKPFVTIVKSLADKIAVDPVSGVPSFNIQLGDIVRPEYTLNEIFSFIANADKPCIIAIDEFQQIMNYPEKNVEALIRSHLLQINNSRMIFSGSEKHLLARMFSDYTRPFYCSASFLELKPIPREVYVEFIMEMFEEKGKKIRKELAERIYDTFDGVTFYVQRVCNGVFGNTSPGSEATEEILEYSLDEILNSMDFTYRLALSRLTTRQKELLFAIAREKSVEQITSVEFIDRHSLASASAVQTAMKSLLKNLIIARTGKEYTVEDCFFRLWIARNF